MRPGAMAARIGVGVLLASGLLLGGAAAAQAPSREARRRDAEDRAADRALARAEDAQARGRLGRALDLLEASARRLPRDPRAALRLCELAVPESDVTLERWSASPATVRALAARCEASLAIWGDSSAAPDAHVAEQLAWARALQGDRGPSLTRLASRPLDERDIGPLRRLATLATADGALEDADAALTLARRVRPNDLELASLLGAVRLARGDAGSAVTLLRAVVAGRPGDREALHDLAGACLQAGEVGPALRYLEQLASAEPDVAARWLELARARIEAGAPAAAADDARRALALAGASDGAAAVALGDALRLSGDATGARAAYEEALHRDPGSVRARRALDALEAEGADR